MADVQHPYSAEGRADFERRQESMRLLAGVACVLAFAVLVWRVHATVTTPLPPEDYDRLNTSRDLQNALEDLSETGSDATAAASAVAGQVDAAIKKGEATQAVVSEMKLRIESDEASPPEDTEPAPNAENQETDDAGTQETQEETTNTGQ